MHGDKRRRRRRRKFLKNRKRVYEVRRQKGITFYKTSFLCFWITDYYDIKIFHVYSKLHYIQFSWYSRRYVDSVSPAYHWHRSTECVCWPSKRSPADKHQSQSHVLVSQMHLSCVFSLVKHKSCRGLLTRNTK